MDMNELKFTTSEYKLLTKGCIGSLVQMKCGAIGWRGMGIVTGHRKYFGSIHVKVHWIRSPYLKYPEQRKVGWILWEKLKFVSKPE